MIEEEAIFTGSAVILPVEKSLASSAGYCLRQAKGTVQAVLTALVLHNHGVSQKELVNYC